MNGNPHVAETMSDGETPIEHRFDHNDWKDGSERKPTVDNTAEDALTFTRRKVLLTTGAIGVAGGLGYAPGIAGAQDVEELCEAVPHDVMLVLDRSGSMSLDPDGDGNTKLDDLKAAAEAFVDRLTTSDLVGLVSYADSATLDAQLTDDHAGVKTAINALTASGLTNIADGIDTAHGEFMSSRDRPDADNIMVVLSNGVPVASPDPVPEADQAKADGIRLITVALGEDANDSLMQELASDPTSDNFFDAPTGTDVDAIFETITQEICPLEIEIDIKPGSDPNAINCGNRGTVPVAVLTTSEFDAATVKPSSLRFGSPSEIVAGNGATLAHGDGHIEDADGDGDDDHVGHYPTQDTGFVKSDVEGWLVGETMDGTNIAGRDSVKIVGNCD